jgi:hypothetical protein
LRRTPAVAVELAGHEACSNPSRSTSPDALPDLNQIVRAPSQPARYRPRNPKLSSHEEEKRLRALGPEVAAYVDFILGTPMLRHQFLRRLWALHQHWGTALFRRTLERAHR